MYKEVEIAKVDGLIDNLFDKFNELTGLEQFFEPDQFYGTDCFGYVIYNPSTFDYSINQIITKIEEIKQGIQKYGHNQTMSDSEVILYLISQGLLPKKNILFEVSY